MGVILVLLATLAAAYAPIENPAEAIISRAHILEQTLYIVECGLVLSLFLFAAYHHLNWNHRAFGILLGFGVVSCELLAAWALTANAVVPDKRVFLDFLNMGTYHVAVLIWMYYLLIPERAEVCQVSVVLPEHNLDAWNRELERLLQQ
jgi:hypothetical protein